MFSNVCEVVQQLYDAKQGGYTFDIEWDSSPYRDPDRASDP